MINKKTIIFLSFICFLVFNLVYLFNQNNNYVNINFDKSNINNAVYNSIDYESIINKLKIEYNNQDVVGVLEINNSDFIVPILQGDDNDYYLNHDIYGNKNYLGSIYLDYRVDIDTSKKLLIFGHNSYNIDAPFKILENFYDKDYYDNHKYVEITTSKTKKRYEIFSVYVETDDFSYMRINFYDELDYINHLNKLKSKSIYDTGVELSSNDEILILQTCSYNLKYSDYSKKYLLIILRRI